MLLETLRVEQEWVIPVAVAIVAAHVVGFVLRIAYLEWKASKRRRNRRRYAR